MPRPKGSKNKKKAAAANVDYAAQISEKQGHSQILCKVQ